MEFREQLMELRKQRGWSQEQLGAKIGVTRQTVSKWETGDTTPELAKLIELSSLFEISVDRLIGIEERKDTAPVYIHETGWNYEYKSKTTFRGLPLVRGTVEFPLKNGVSSVEIRQAILDKFPGTWKWLVRLYGTLGR